MGGWSSAALATTLVKKQTGIHMDVFSFANTNTSHARETLKLVAENRCALRHPSILVNNGDQLMEMIVSSGVVGKRSAPT